MEYITARSILVPNKRPDDWFGVRYNMNIYRGCPHGCIYCDSRSQCYGIEDFQRVQVKGNAIELLRMELASKRYKCTIGTGSMSDPYNPLEEELKMTRQALETIANSGFGIHISTKGHMVVRDVDLLLEIKKAFASVAFTITTCRDELAKLIEPGAPLPSRRLMAMEKLAESGIYVGVLMMPILPFILDDARNIITILRRSAQHGASYVIPWFGMSLRDRQREYYYERIDNLFPGISQRYMARYGADYNCLSSAHKSLEVRFKEECQALGLTWDMSHVQKFGGCIGGTQLSLLEQLKGEGPNEETNNN